LGEGVLRLMWHDRPGHGKTLNPMELLYPENPLYLELYRPGTDLPRLTNNPLFPAPAGPWAHHLKYTSYLFWSKEDRGLGEGVQPIMLYKKSPVLLFYD